MATITAGSRRIPTWLTGLVPLVAIAALVVVFLVANPIATLREIPPVEAIAFERTVFLEDGIELQLRNDGPDPVHIAQVLVNDAYWDFSATDPNLGRLESSDLRIPYPWEDGMPVNIALITSTGVTIEHEVEVAALTPEPDASTLGIYALLGLYIGVIPVAIGLMWFPSLRRADKRWLNFFLALTLGLLAFLLIDTVAEGLELSAATPASLNGLGLFALGALGAVLGLIALEVKLNKRRDEAQAGSTAFGGLALAYLIAGGIGLHNMGEGLAVGAALATGETALGTFLVLGFALHNTTEGLAIVAPLGRAKEQRPSLWHFAALGAIAGVPAILGAWLGGFAYSPAWAALAFGIAAGAIAQVLWQIGRSMLNDRGLTSKLGPAGFIAGFMIMYVTGLFAV
ncbi:MAG: ZIP family metal transporter [Actinomycetota bacterium]|nr:ZIP family metal transporter [Actinomycetota bacterium]